MFKHYGAILFTFFSGCVHGTAELGAREAPSCKLSEAEEDSQRKQAFRRLLGRLDRMISILGVRKLRHAIDFAAVWLDGLVDASILPLY